MEVFLMGLKDKLMGFIAPIEEDEDEGYGEEPTR